MSLKKDFNYVKRIFKTPCHNQSIGLYVETGLTAAGIAAFDVLSFGCREPLKHAAGRGQFAEWFGTGNRRGVFPSGHRRIGATGKGIPPTGRAGASFFWGFSALLERTLFYFFLAEVGKDFALNWSSMLYAANGCDGPYAGFCEWKIGPQIAGPGLFDLLIGEGGPCHDVLSDTRAIYIPTGLTASVSYYVNAQPWPPANNPNATLSTFLWDDTDGKAYAASDQRPAGSGDTGTVGFQHNIPGPTVGYRRISVRSNAQNGYMFVTDGRLQVTLHGRHVPMLNLTDCFKQKGQH